MSISDRIIKVVAERQNCLTSDIKFEDQMGRDSLEKLDLLVGIEDEFGIKVADNEMGMIKSYNDLLSLVSVKLGVVC